jgi:hypothetical protein
MPKTIKLNKNDDIAQVIQKIKNMREKEAIFEAESGSVILMNSANLRLMRKTAEVLGKSIQLKTDDSIGQVLAVKAGMPLYGQEAPAVQPIRPKSMAAKSRRVGPRSSAGKGGMSDMGPGRRSAKPAASKAKSAVSSAAAEEPIMDDEPRYVPKISMPTAAETARAAVPVQNQKAAKPKRRWWRVGGDYSKVLLLTAVVLVIIIFASVVLLPRADITVYARSEPITRDADITVDKDAKNPDSTRQTIPGEIVAKEVSNTKTFQTSGTKNVGEKATGSIILYNFTKNTLTLKASTTTLLINGKKYFFTKDVTGIRPTARIGTGADQEIDQSSLGAPVPIIADQAGEAYNLSANQKFTVQNAALGETEDVYAMNPGAITGGTSKTIKIMSQEDLDRATAEMTDEIATVAETELAKDNQNSHLKILPTGSNKEILAKTANKNVGDEAEEFDMTVIGRLTGLAYDEQNVKSVFVDQINEILGDDKYLLEDGQQNVSAKFKSLDLANGRGVLTVHFETVAAYKINNNNLSKTLAGKNAIQIKEILLSRPEVDRVDVKFSPFFVNKAPRWNGKVYINSVISQ